MSSSRCVLSRRAFVAGIVVSMLGLALPDSPTAQAATAPASAPVATPAPAPVSARSTLPQVAAPAGLCEGCQELPELRTAASRTYVDSRGGRRVLVLPDDVNYRSGTDWVPMDNRLDAATGGGWRNRANAYAVALPANVSSPIRLDHGASWLSFRLEGANAAGTASGDTVTYVNALPGVDAAYAATNAGLKETLTLAGPKAASSFRYGVGLSPGLSLALAAGGSIDVLDASGRRVASFQAPFMVDASGTPGGYSSDVTFALARAGQGWTVSMSASRAFLDAPERRWPVVIDPIVAFKTTPETDCYVASASPTTNYCSASTMELEKSATAERRPMLRFDSLRAVIPRTAIVMNAQLGVYLESRTGADVATATTMHSITRSWTSAANWNTYNGTNAWTTAGADHTSTPAATLNVAGVGWYQQFYPTALVQAWVNGTTANNGVLVKSATGDVMRFTSWQGADSTKWPFLWVAYDELRGDHPPSGYFRQQLTDRLDMAVNLASGNVHLNTVDFRIGGTGLDSVVARYWDQKVAYDDTYGSLWGLAQPNLSIYGDGSAGFFAADGPIGSYQPNGSGGFLYLDGSGADLTKVTTPATEYTLTFRGDGHKLVFNATGILTKALDRNANQISYAYNGAGDLATTTDTQGRTITYTYSATTGRLTTIADNAGSRTVSLNYGTTGCVCALMSETDAAGKATTYEYDAGGLVAKIIDAEGRMTKIDYDAEKRVNTIVRVTDDVTRTGPTYTFAYTLDASGIGGSTVITDPRGNNTTHYYDAQGRITRVVDPLAHEKAQTYTANSNVDSYQGNSSSAVFNLTYNTNNSVTQIQSPASATGQSAATGYLTYPATGLKFRPDSRTDAQQNCQSFRYDGPGNLTEVHDGLAPTANSCAGQTSTVKHVQTYNTNGTLATQQAPGGSCTAVPKVRCTTYAYTYTGSVLQRIVITPPTPLGAETANFDAVGRVADVTDGRGKKTTYSYDAIDRITRLLYDGTTTCSAPATCTNYTYDGGGNLTQRIDVTGTTNFVLDKLSRVTKKDFPSADADCAGQGGTTYTYDLAGDVASACDAGGTTTYQFDAANNACWQLLGTSANTCASPPTGSVRYAYDADKRRTSTVYPSNPAVTMSAEYLPDGSLKKIEANKATTPTPTLLTRRSYIYAIGTADTSLRRTMTNEAGTVTSFGYDAFNKLCWVKVATASGTCASPPSGADRFGYDENANRTSTTLGGTTTTYGFNQANQLTSGSPTTPVYDGAGNETTGPNARTATYTAKGQTASFTPSGGSAVSATYADADSTERSAFGASTFFDTPQGLVVGRTASVNTYYQRDDSGTLVALRTGASTYYYVFDGLGSVIALVNAATGNADRTYTYDSWGNITASTGTLVNPFRYAGGFHDTETGLTKFGTRYFDPAYGRWTQRDPLAGSIADPRTVNRYAYVGNNPLNFIDPSGTIFLLSALDIVATTVGVVAGVASVVGVCAIGCAVVGLGAGIYGAGRLLESRIYR